jgi:hypothetical protein
MWRTAEERWHCLNRDCGKTLPASETDSEGDRHFCECGSSMKKSVQPAVFSYLDFLREGITGEEGENAGKERGPWER